MAEPKYTIRDAEFSPDRAYRYRLHAIWDPDLPLAAFIMLNPSTADETQLDPTLRRCLGYAQAWDCGGFVVGNLFAYRATDPADMKAAKDPVGPLNDEMLVRIARACAIVVCAWGSHGSYMFRSDTVRRLLANAGPLSCLRLNGNGEPAHPLYLPAALKLTPYPRSAPPTPERKP